MDCCSTIPHPGGVHRPPAFSTFLCGLLLLILCPSAAVSYVCPAVSKRLLGRGAYVLLFNNSGQLFVSQRSLSKDCYPGCLDVTISGVVNWVRHTCSQCYFVAACGQQLLIALSFAKPRLVSKPFAVGGSTCHMPHDVQRQIRRGQSEVWRLFKGEYTWMRQPAQQGQ